MFCKSMSLHPALRSKRGEGKMLLWLLSEKLLPMFSSRIFMISGLTFRSLFHFDFIFVCSLRKWCSFTLLHIAVQLVSSCPVPYTSWWRDFFPLHILSSSIEINCTYNCGFLISGSSVLLIYVSTSVPVPHYFDKYSFVI